MWPLLLLWSLVSLAFVSHVLVAVWKSQHGIAIPVTVSFVRAFSFAPLDPRLLRPGLLLVVGCPSAVVIVSSGKMALVMPVFAVFIVGSTYRGAVSRAD
jgi:hypothetical protein